MTVVGVGTCGFTRYELPAIIQDMRDDFEADISPALDTASDQPMGQIIGIFADRLASLWDMGQHVYTAFDPDKAEDASQDAVCALTGTQREAASKSYVKQNLSLSAGTTVNPGAIVASSVDNSIRFVLVGPWPADGELPAAGPITAGTTGVYQGRFEAENTGPVTAAADTLTVIVTPVSGWTATTNPLDAEPGRNIEKSSELRVRREEELAAVGSSPVDAIRAELLKLEDMIDVQVFENTSEVTDADGLTPHSIECLVFDGPSPSIPNNTIAQTIWDARAGGIKVHGVTSATAIDARGVSHSVPFTRATQVSIYFTIDIRVDSSFAGSGDDAVKDAIVAKGDTFKPGDDVILTGFYPAILGIQGVTDVIVFRAGTAPSPASTINIPIGSRAIALFDTSRIVINHV
jgi:uncharacterized phage protein gp47/JayE